MKSIFSDEYREIIRRLKQARTECGMSQEAACRRLSKPQNYLSKIESCQRRMDVLELLVLGKLYGKPLSFFTDDLTIELPTAQVFIRDKEQKDTEGDHNDKH